MEGLTVGVAVLLVLTSSEVGSASGGKLVGKLWLVLVVSLVVILNLVGGLSLVGVCTRVSSIFLPSMKSNEGAVRCW